jgi:hypothetical protein
MTLLRSAVLGICLFSPGCKETPPPATSDLDQAPQAPDLSPPQGWRTGPPLPSARTEVAAAVAGGKLYVLGGFLPNGTTDEVSIYDPRAGGWSKGPPLPAGAPRDHLAVAALNDKIYVLGGYRDGDFVPLGKTWVLDGTWQPLQDQPISRGAATAQALGDRIYVAGGALLDGQAVADLYIYDPQGDRWSKGPPMNVAREHLASCALGGRLIVVGGRSRGQNLRAAESFDPAMPDRWRQMPDLPTARGGLAAAALDGRCHAVGGEKLNGEQPNTFHEHEAWDGVAWRALPPLPSRRHGLAAAALAGQLYVASGGPSAGLSVSDVVEIYTP